jgi:hypothetical protein
MPVLAIGGEKSLGEVLGAQMKSVARNVGVATVGAPPTALNSTTYINQE